MIKHIGTCTLETKRLCLRKFSKDDAQMVFRNWTNDQELAKYVIWPIHKQIETTIKVLEQWERAYQKSNVYQWAIVLKENQEVIGSISLFNVMFDFYQGQTAGELGYCLSRHYWNKGIMTEAASAVLTFAFKELSVKCIKARHDINNKSSQRVIEKLGMQRIGVLKKFCQNAQGDWIDCHVYHLHKDDFLNFEDNRYVLSIQS